MKKYIWVVCLLCASFFKTAEAAKIVVTIPPLLSAIKPLLSPEDSVQMLLPKGQTPHAFSLKPSNLLAIQDADIIVSVGSGVDHWAQKAIANRQAQGQVSVIKMTDIPGITLIQGGDDHKHGQGVKDHDEHENEHDELHINPHLWLDMGNIEKLVQVFGKTLAKHSPSHAEKTLAKTNAWLAELKATDADIQHELQPVEKVPYLVFHNAYVYFEKRYSLNNQGALHNGALQKAGVKRLMTVDEMIRQHQVQCVFQEPQQSAKQLKGLIRGSAVKLGMLDPLGDGSLNTVQFMQGLTHQFLDCLADSK